VTSIHIEIDDLSRPAVQALLAEHLHDMHTISPRESVHALDLQQLRVPHISFWSAWDGTLLLGCGALKTLDTQHGELKSMRTSNAHRRRGAGRAIIGVARLRANQRISLETGALAAFMPAQKLYESFGFRYCAPFAAYSEDPNSVFMSLWL
jgi:putative acetyltransferase